LAFGGVSVYVQMAQRDNILQELNELGSSLINTSLSNVYRVPGQYFEGLAGQIMARIRAMESIDDEADARSSLLDSISREMPYRVPQGYFDGLEKKLMQLVLQTEKEETPAEELESLSPLLSGIKKQVPYSVPEGYFENLVTPAEETKQKAKVVSLGSRKWFRYAAAAVIIGFVALGGFLFLGGNNGTTDPQDIVNKTVKSVGDEGISNFIESTIDGALNEETPVIAQAEEIKDLVKNISDEEIQDFVNEVQVEESDLTEDILLN
jgi:hypothetical protein